MHLIKIDHSQIQFLNNLINYGYKGNNQGSRDRPLIIVKGTLIEISSIIIQDASPKIIVFKNPAMILKK